MLSRRVSGALCVVAAMVASACGSSGKVNLSPAASTGNGSQGNAPTSVVATTSAGGAATTTAAVDVTRLPVGDGKVVNQPTRGAIFGCRTTFGGGGASAKGPWFNDDGTWNATKKVTVDGAVKWPNANVTITLTGATRTISGNLLPDHVTGAFPIASTDDAYRYDRNPNTIKAQTLSVSLPATPMVAATASCVGGEVGYSIDGVAIFDGFDAGGRDAVAWEIQDECHGHPQISGVYHYHDLSSCVADAGAGHSALIGYARDGFGIYGYRGADGKELTNADLDECHGHTHTITWDGKDVAMYHYHATREFPYTVGCFRGASAARTPTGG
jgi:hypothetical protein